MQQQQKLTPQEIRRLPPSERPPEKTPPKFTGAHIPSRSFRLLQLITGEDIENQYQKDGLQQAPMVHTHQPQRPASSQASFGTTSQRPSNPPPPIPAHQTQKVKTVVETVQTVQQQTIPQQPHPQQQMVQEQMSPKEQPTAYTPMAANYGTDF